MAISVAKPSHRSRSTLSEFTTKLTRKLPNYQDRGKENKESERQVLMTTEMSI